MYKSTIKCLDRYKWCYGLFKVIIFWLTHVVFWNICKRNMLALREVKSLSVKLWLMKISQTGRKAHHWHAILNFLNRLLRSDLEIIRKNPKIVRFLTNSLSHALCNIIILLLYFLSSFSQSKKSMLNQLWK